jgi:ComF family protein
MAGTAAAIARALKYGGWSGLADEMAARMAGLRFSRAVEAELSGVVPVPLGAARRRRRGYNQAELLARCVAERRGWPLLEDVLFRSRETRHQARLSSGERQRNVKGAFSVARGCESEVADRHLLLVDDVLTTAATALDCVRALCGAGARAVSVLTFARARPELAGDGR